MKPITTFNPEKLAPTEKALYKDLEKLLHFTNMSLVKVDGVIKIVMGLDITKEKFTKQKQYTKLTQLYAAKLPYPVEFELVFRREK